MDPLDHLAGPSAELLARVDALLVDAGAPANHPIWALLRRLGALPGDAVGTVDALRSAPLAAAAPPLRELIREYDVVRASLAEGGSWEGAGADAFAAQRGALATYLAGGEESLTGRLATTASYAEALAEWVAQSRDRLARTLAEVLGSAEAVAVVTGGATTPSTGAHDGDQGATQARAGQAAAEIGARVLATVAEAYDQAEALLHGWAAGLAELPYRAPVEGASRLDGGTTRIGP